MATSYHYPSELFELLVDAIPRLVKTKQGVLQFFWSAGVNHSATADIEVQLRADRDSVSKFHIVRTLLTQLNEAGDGCIRERRELLKRVCEFEAFSTGWPKDQLTAKGLVAEIRDLVDKHDFFRKLQQKRETELREHREKEREKSDNLRKRNAELENIRQDFYSLFTSSDPRKRGKQLEEVLGRFFAAHGILVREPFALIDGCSGKINEQVDGVVEFDGHLYLVEMKWLTERVDVVDVSRHINRVITRADCRGLFISYSGYTRAAINACRDMMRDAPIVLSTLQEFVALMERAGSVQDFLKEKSHRLIIDKDPFVEILDSKSLA